MRRIINILVMIAGVLSFPLLCRAEDVALQYQDLRKQIAGYNLVNGLYLSNEQMEFILTRVKEITALKQKLQKETESHLASQKEVLLTLKEEVKKESPHVSPDLAKKIHENEVYVEQLRKDYIDVVTKAAKEIKDNLTESQQYIIQNFRPCLVPPKGPKRAGQSPLESEFIVLEKIRKLPIEQYEKRKNTFVERFITRISLKYPRLSENELNEIRSKLLKIMEDTRNLSDVDFALKKDAVVQEIKDIKKKEINVDVEQSISKFLLEPQIISILEEKLSS